MKIPKELDEKLRKLLASIENPLLTLKEEMRFWDGENENLEIEVIKSLNLRSEIIDLINTPCINGKYKQLDLEEEIKKTVNQNY